MPYGPIVNLKLELKIVFHRDPSHAKVPTLMNSLRAIRLKQWLIGYVVEKRPLLDSLKQRPNSRALKECKLKVRFESQNKSSWLIRPNTSGTS